MRRKRKYLPKIFKIIFFLIFLLILIGGINLIPKLIWIKKIVCQSQFNSCNPLVEAALKKAENLDIRSSKRMVKLVLSESILVKDYSVQFKLPDSLEVEVIERKPKFAITNEAKSTYALVDKEGQVISLTAISNLPYLISKETLPLAGDKVLPDTLFALELVSGISSYYSVVSASLEKDSLVINLSSSPSLIFPLKGDKEVLLGAANLILTQLKSENGNSKIEDVDKVSLIDLRFKNPVIR